MSLLPCQSDPNAWFGAERRGVRSAAQQATIDRVKSLCVNKCPEQRRCAQRALRVDATYGVWAGVELPGYTHTYGQRNGRLRAAREQLQAIAESDGYLGCA